MKPKTPFTQPFDKLPEELPLYTLENALLPGGQLPLELSEANDLAMFLDTLKTDQLIGMVQPQGTGGIYQTGCAGRIRQYRERSDGRLNIMLTGLCRYKIIEELAPKNGYRVARVDWSGFEHDYDTENVDNQIIENFRIVLRSYFERHNMQVDWQALDKLHIENVVNNLVLILNLSIDNKQQLLESPTLKQRLELFAELLEEKSAPIVVTATASKLVN
jgi:Lon protease-like protein